MTVLLVFVLLLVAAAGTAVVFTRDPASQPIGISFFGLIVALMFMLFQAPDVALSQIVIGAVGLPMMILLALAKLRRDADLRAKAEKAKEGDTSKPEARA